jgi:hypothetical protein
MVFNRSLTLTALVLLGVSRLAGAQQTFDDPKHDGLSVSYCDASRTTCGAPVAATWCREQGFEIASEWAVRPGLDFSTATIRLDDGGICRGAQCDSFGSITCGGQGDPTRTFRMPKLGAQGRVTLLAPNRRTTETAFEGVEYQVLIPGCHTREGGTYLCENVHDYQHCRTLLKAGRVHACRAGLAFDGGFAEPTPAAPGTYELELDSSAEAIVEKERPERGRLKGDVRFEVSFESPEGTDGMWCLQRDRYTYHPTGPEGGLGAIDDTDDCDEPIQGTFAPHEDDLIQAYALCEAFDAWGEDLEQPVELMVAALFTVGSARPSFVSANGGATTILASYLTIEAPMKVKCKD